MPERQPRLEPEHEVLMREREQLEQRLEALKGKTIIGATVGEGCDVTIMLEGGMKLEFTSWGLNYDSPNFNGVEVTSEND